MNFILKVPGRIPLSLNQVMNWTWQKRRTYKRDWNRHIANAILVARCDQGLPIDPKFERFDLRLQSNYHQNPIKDDDNLHGAWKAVIDSLVHHLILADDTRENIVTKVMMQIKVSRAEYKETIITITPLP